MNIAKRLQITGVGKYDVHITYVGPKTLAQTPPLVATVKLVVALDEAKKSKRNN